MNRKDRKRITDLALRLAHMGDQERYDALAFLLESMVAYSDSERPKHTIKAVMRERFGGCEE